MFNNQPQKPPHSDLPQALLILAFVVFGVYPKYKDGTLQEFFKSKPRAEQALQESVAAKAAVKQVAPVPEAYQEQEPVYSDTPRYATAPTEADQVDAQPEPDQEQEQEQQSQPAQQAVQEPEGSYYSDSFALRKTE